MALVGFCAADADAGVEVSGGGATASSWPDADGRAPWRGVRGRAGVLRGAYCYEVKVDSPALMRVGWATGGARRNIGTDAMSFAYTGTGKKSTANAYEPYGRDFAGACGCVVTCLLDRRDAQRQTISFSLDGEWLGEAFVLPAELAEEPLFPAVCGRGRWSATCRFEAATISEIPAGYLAIASCVDAEQPEEQAEEWEVVDEQAACSVYWPGAPSSSRSSTCSTACEDWDETPPVLTPSLSELEGWGTELLPSDSSDAGREDWDYGPPLLSSVPRDFEAQSDDWRDGELLVDLERPSPRCPTHAEPPLSCASCRSAAGKRVGAYCYESGRWYCQGCWQAWDQAKDED